eukprot:4559424-Amphidinium_carterae.1
MSTKGLWGIRVADATNTTNNALSSKLHGALFKRFCRARDHASVFLRLVMRMPITALATLQEATP